MAQEQLWQRLLDQAEIAEHETPAMAAALETAIRQHDDFTAALAATVAGPMAQYAPVGLDIAAICRETIATHPQIAADAALDLDMLVRSNPACLNELIGLLGFRGWQGVQAYRVAHALFMGGQPSLAALLQNWAAQAWAMDISAQAQIAAPVWIDHGIGVVIGDTAVIEAEVSIWHGVTLGSKLTDPSNPGQRHPTLRRGATLCAGAAIIGNIEVGAGALVAANSVVLKSVPAGATVAGAPAQIVKQRTEA